MDYGGLKLTRESLVICMKYEDIFFFLFRSSHRVGLLKIIRGWNNFSELIKFVVGDGS